MEKHEREGTKKVRHNDERDEIVIAYMRHMHEMYRMRVENLGGPVNAALVRLILLGHFEDKPYDISDLAFELLVSRQTVMRRLDELLELKLIYIDKESTHSYARPTPYLIKYACDQVPPLVVKQFKAFASMHSRLVKHGSWTELAKRVTPLIKVAAAVMVTWR